jgi:hypothetical protein
MRHYQLLSVAHGCEKYGRVFHPDRVKRLRGHWTIGFHPERIVLPSARGMRRWVEGEPLDATHAERAHMMVDSAWFANIGRPLAAGAPPVEHSNLSLSPEIWLPDCVIDLTELDDWQGADTYRGHDGLLDFLAGWTEDWDEVAGITEEIAPGILITVRRRRTSCRKGRQLAYEVTELRGRPIWRRYPIARRLYFSEHAQAVDAGYALAGAAEAARPASG